MHLSFKSLIAFASSASLAVTIGFVAKSGAEPAHDKYALKVPGGLAFAEFKGYEGWQVVSLSRNDKAMAVILANPVMIDAYRAGAPDNGKPFPDGAKMAKVHWTPKKQAFFPETSVPGPQHDVDFMEKDAKRFVDSGGWGYAAFESDPATGAFRAADATDHPPQANDARCGFACHTKVKTRDFVFTEYAPR